jgi:hypothetical protein
MYGSEGSIIVLRYQKSLTNLSADIDVDTIPDGIDFIPDIAAASIYMDRGEEMRGLNLNDNIAVPRVISFYQQMRQATKETQFGKKIYYGDTANGITNNNYLYNGPQV